MAKSWNPGDDLSGSDDEGPSRITTCERSPICLICPLTESAATEFDFLIPRVACPYDAPSYQASIHRTLFPHNRFLPSYVIHGACFISAHVLGCVGRKVLDFAHPTGDMESCGKHPCAIWNLRGVSPVGRTAQSGRENQSAAPTAETAGEIAERPGEVFTREELRRRVWPRRRKVLVILIRHSTLLSRSSGVR